MPFLNCSFASRDHEGAADGPIRRVTRLRLCRKHDAVEQKLAGGIIANQPLTTPVLRRINFSAGWDRLSTTKSSRGLCATPGYQIMKATASAPCQLRSPPVTTTASPGEPVLAIMLSAWSRRRITVVMRSTWATNSSAFTRTMLNSPRSPKNRQIMVPDMR